MTTFVDWRYTTKLPIITVLVLNYFCHAAQDLYEGSDCNLYDGRLGTCKSLMNCQWAIENLRNETITYGDLRRTRCSFVGNIEIICCGDERPSERTSEAPPNIDGNDDDIYFFNNNDLFPSVSRTSSTVKPSVTVTTTPLPSRLGLRKSETACLRYTELSSPFLSFNILGGIPTNLGEFPHMAALGYSSQEVNDNEYDFNCGGSIISEWYILTAAHCITDRSRPVVVRMGKITLHTDDDGTVGLTTNIDQITSHPNYRTSRSYNDIALIRVMETIPFSDNIRPACLRTNMSDIDPGVELIVTGWGSTSVERAERSNVLLKTNLTAVGLQSCNTSLLEYDRNDRSFRNGIMMGQMCAYDPLSRNDACQGDSGGPLQLYNVNGVSTIVGVTSFGIACGSLLPSVYTRVAFYLEWIESIVWTDTTNR